MTRPSGSPRLGRGRVVTIVWLAIVWMALWGSIEVATFVAGLLIGTVVAFALRPMGASPAVTFHPLSALRYAGVFAGMLVQATFEVVAAVISPRTRVAPAVVDVSLPAGSDALVTLVANSITLTPGTITLDAVRGPGGATELRVHALNASDPEALRRDVLRLYQLAAAAIGGAPTPSGPSARTEA
jgi:multicomponent Na+:H+ antiporter subunit E